MKTLIVKLGALGDVVRTTVLLSELEGEIYWLTKSNAKDLLNSDKISKIFFFERQSDLDSLLENSFDCIISLDEEIEVLNFIKKIKTKRVIGVFLNNKNKVDYTKESVYWFDMSLSSKFGKKEADVLKMKNKKSVPEILIEMIGKSWTEQEYDLGILPKDSEKNKIGLISVSTSNWPNKNWIGWDKLFYLLKEDGYSPVHLLMKENLIQHIDEINSCVAVVCGDTLGMHLALALKKKVFVLFNCTSPQEIYDYHRLIKVLSPVLNQYYYKKTFNHEAQSAIKPEIVFELIKNSVSLEK
jgi:heptosyltransferase-2